MSLVLGFVYGHTGAAGVGYYDADIAEVSQFTSILGYIGWISPIDQTRIILPNIQKTTSIIQINTQSSVNFISLPALTYVGPLVGGYWSFSLIGDTVLTAVTLPSLTYIEAITSIISITDNPLLTLVSMPALQGWPASLGTNGVIQICHNNAAFAIPMAIVEAWETNKCKIAVGAATCPGAFTSCPISMGMDMP